VAAPERRRPARSAAPTQTRRQQQGERSRNELLQVAKRLMAERGYTGMSIAQLSAASGLSTSSIYWHFGSKDGVLAAVVEEGLRRFFESRPATDSFEGDAVERLDAMLSASARMLEEEPEYLRLLLLLTLERHDGDEASLAVVHEMREVSLRHWEEGLSAIFAVGEDASPERRDLVRQLALLGRCVADGAFIASVDGEAHMGDVYATFMRMVCALAREEGA
jgi:AcrR family transcriptional regulator